MDTSSANKINLIVFTFAQLILVEVFLLAMSLSWRTLIADTRVPVKDFYCNVAGLQVIFPL